MQYLHVLEASKWWLSHDFPIENGGSSLLLLISPVASLGSQSQVVSRVPGSRQEAFESCIARWRKRQEQGKAGKNHGKNPWGKLVFLAVKIYAPENPWFLENLWGFLLTHRTGKDIFSIPKDQDWFIMIYIYIYILYTVYIIYTSMIICEYRVSMLWFIYHDGLQPDEAPEIS